MTQRTRIILGIVSIFVLVGIVLGVDLIRRQRQELAVPEVPPGAIPIFIEGQLIDSFIPADLEQLEPASFIDNEEGKTQDGWLLRDALLLYADESSLKPNSVIMVFSSSRDKSVEIPWSEVQNLDNMVMFDLAGKGTLKLVSKAIPYLDIRDEWVQDVDRIEIFLSP